MEHIKLQVGALIVLVYIAFIYLRECKKYHRELTETLFDELLTLGIVSVILDGATAFTVNNADIVHPLVNTILHAVFLSAHELWQYPTSLTQFPRTAATELQCRWISALKSSHRAADRILTR